MYSDSEHLTAATLVLTYLKTEVHLFRKFILA